METISEARPVTDTDDDGFGQGLWASEQLVLCRDDEVGLRAAIAVDDTTLGPGLGGVRFKPYPSGEAAVAEARRLAWAMTRKNAVAGLPFGGGKSVILDDGRATDRVALMRRFGEFVARLGGSYLPGVDMGTSVADLHTMGEAGAEVSCATEDPSPWTATGVWAAMRAAVAHVDGRAGLSGTRVLIQGAGHVGAALARHVADDGGTVLIADVDAERAAAIAGRLGGEVVAPDALLDADCDVFAPCAVARVIGPETIDRLRCRIVAGAANDTLTAASVAGLLAAQGITYVPDYVANAGGVVQIHALRAGWDENRLRSEVLAIGDRVSRILTDAEATDVTPLVAAERQAEARIAAARADRRA